MKKLFGMPVVRPPYQIYQNVGTGKFIVEFKRCVCLFGLIHLYKPITLRVETAREFKVIYEEFNTRRQAVEAARIAFIQHHRPSPKKPKNVYIKV